MIKLIRHIYVLTMLISLSTYADSYDNVSSVLNSFKHRLTGSSNYLKSLEVIEKELNKHGIKTHRQNFP